MKSNFKYRQDLNIIIVSSFVLDLRSDKQQQGSRLRANGCNIVGQNSQHCWMLHVASVCTPCCMLLDVVACCRAKFETGQTFQPTTPSIFFVLLLPKRSTTMLDPFEQLFKHCWDHARSLCMVYKELMGCILPTMHCRSQHCWELLHPFAHHCQHGRNSSQHCYIVGATMLGVVASVCMQPKAGNLQQFS